MKNCPFGKDFGNSNVQKFYDMLLFCKKEEEVRKYIVLCLSNFFGKEGREMEAEGQKRKKGRKGEKEGEGGKRERKRKKGKGKEGEPERRGESRKWGKDQPKTDTDNTVNLWGGDTNRSDIDHCSWPSPINSNWGWSRNSGRALTGPLLQQRGERTSSRFPRSLLKGVSWLLTWAEGWGDREIGQEGWLRWFAPP